MPLGTNGVTNNQNGHQLDNGASAAPKLYLGSGSGLGFLSGGSGGSTSTNPGT